MDNTGVSEWFRQLFGLPTPVEARGYGGYSVATFTDPQRELATAVTIGFSAHDTGLRTTPPEEANPTTRSADVRVELITQATVEYQQLVESVLAAAALTLLSSPEHICPQPGTVLPELSRVVRRWPGTACHGLFVAPELWQQGVPHLWEEPESRGAEGLYTLPIQLLMLTPEEYAYGVTYSFPALIEEAAVERRNFADWGRSD